MSINQNIEASIKTEAASNRRQSTDIDNFRNFYSDFDPFSKLYVKFPSFDIISFEQNFYIIAAKSKEVPFINRWIMRPDYVSQDYYRTTVLWPMILYLNGVFTIEEFRGFKSILVPPMNVVIDLVKNRNVDKEILKASEEKKPSNKINRFYKKYPLDKFENDQRRAAKELTESGVPPTVGIYNVEKTETFTLTSTDIANKYVLLNNEASSPSSIILSLNNYNLAQRYGYDYVLTYDDSGKLKKISWNSSDVITSTSTITIPSSMSTYLKVGDIVKVAYTVSVIYKISDGIPNV